MTERQALAKSTPVAGRSSCVGWETTSGYVKSQRVPAHPTIVALYVGSLRDRKLTKATILVHLAAIAYAHELLGFAAPWHSSPELKSEMRGLRRADDDDRQSREAIEQEFATELLLRLPPPRTLTQLRDHAVFCLGWLSALRRSDMAALRRRDVVFLRDSKDQTRYLELFVRRSKTDQEGRGRHLVITELPGTLPLCAIRALEAWLAVAPLAPDDRSFRLLASGAGRRIVVSRAKPSSLAMSRGSSNGSSSKPASTRRCTPLTRCAAALLQQCKMRAFATRSRWSTVAGSPKIRIIAIIV